MGWVAVSVVTGLAMGAVALIGCRSDPVESRPLPGGSAGPAGGGDERSGGGGGSPSGGGGAAAVPPCATWEGPFGAGASEIFDPLTAWDGFLPGQIEAGRVRVADLAACGGNHEARALVVYIDAVWCDVCRSVARGLADRYETSWRDRGVAVVSLLVEGADGQPADLEAAWQWRSTYGLEGTPVAIDPGYALANEDPDVLPQALVIDPRTMRIHTRAIGNVDLEPILDQVLAGDGE